ncbi:MAG: ABC transporter substrate-binding protein, partial [Actinomycetota bacterium]|nr:ABC transporter substrate-binding protein [Actinomycetota bacterium]
MRTLGTMRQGTSPVRAGAVTIALAGLLAACATTPPADSGADQSTRDAKIRVVAAENFWGSIAAQVGGDRVTVQN